jgi:hypothetical protein
MGSFFHEEEDGQTASLDQATTGEGRDPNQMG